MIRLRRLESLTPRELRAILDRRASVLDEVLRGVRPIVGRVRREGDRAVRAYTRRFDRVDRASPEVSGGEIRAAVRRTPAGVLRALAAAARRIRDFHRRIAPAELRWTSPHACPGSVLGRRAIPFDRVGVYVPGGSAAYPSTVLMASIPARVAGVREISVATPPGPGGRVPDAVLAACATCRIDRVYAAGGAQAIAALACGTRTIAPVDKIVGPGNAFVTAAKLLVRDQVAIDLPAGPSEILLLSDGAGDPRFIAADLIAQAEHSPDACALLVTTSETQARAVARAAAIQVDGQPRAAIIRRALARGGGVVLCRDLASAVDFTNRYAPEHLGVFTRRPEQTLRSLRHAGSVFLGPFSPVALGDYASGPNHILPTAGTARFYSGLSTQDFVRFVTYQSFSPRGFRRLAPAAIALARAEGLEAHARSLEIRGL